MARFTGLPETSPMQDILSLTPPPADQRIPYGSDVNQFVDLRLPPGKGPHAVVLNLHGGYWRNRYSLEHAGHLCAALTAKGIVTWNLEYRRVGDNGGGWPGTFEDITNGYRFLQQNAARHQCDSDRIVVMGHSAGGHLALCLAGHQKSVTRVVSLAGVVDAHRAFTLHLSNDAVVEFLGGKPDEVPDHYREADPLSLRISATQWLLHGADDDVVPPEFSRQYVEAKKARGEDVHLLEIPRCGHFDVIDPRSEAWKQIEATVLKLLG